MSPSICYDSIHCQTKEVYSMTRIAFVMPDPALVKVVHEAWELHEKILGKSEDLTYTVDCELQP